MEREEGWGVFKNFNLTYINFHKKLQQFGKTFRKSDSVNIAGWIRVPVLHRVWKKIRIQPSLWIRHRIHARMTNKKREECFEKMDVLI